MNLPVYDERRGAFARLRGRRVLIYWPHGLGDFVHLSYILPLVEPSNTYFITRFGDDYVHLYDGCEIATPIYSGIAKPQDGSALHARHLGINFKRIRNAPMEVEVPEPLHGRIEAAGIDTLLYTDYPEHEGRLGFPFHTKARALARDLVSAERLASLPLDRPLVSALPLATTRETTALVEERLRSYVGAAERLIVVAPGGHTTPQKTWPESEVEAFADAMLAATPKTRTVTIDERTSKQIGRDPALAATTQDLFGDCAIPFAQMLIALLRACDAFVGVAAGPLHTALAIGGRPIVGIWLAHYPDWYDENTEGAIHLVGPYALKKRLDRRKATATLPLRLRARTVDFRNRLPGARDAILALESLM
ncbi:MAG: hypothetical protein M3R51_06345 [Candidatus Eremiobacteraeota bacterium]|nr:hypothetical protein [Candidatus Eremiobacteraeota bacterium]